MWIYFVVLYVYCKRYYVISARTAKINGMYYHIFERSFVCWLRTIDVLPSLKSTFTSSSNSVNAFLPCKSCVNEQLACDASMFDWVRADHRARRQQKRPNAYMHEGQHTCASVQLPLPKVTLRSCTWERTASFHCTQILMLCNLCSTRTSCEMRCIALKKLVRGFFLSAILHK